MTDEESLYSNRDRAARERARIEADVQAFLDRGGKIEVVGNQTQRLRTVMKDGVARYDKESASKVLMQDHRARMVAKKNPIEQENDGASKTFDRKRE